MQKRLRTIFLLFLLLIPVTGSLQAQDDDSRLEVVATTTIIADMTRNVGGDLVDVTSLVPPDADVHAFQLTPADALLVEQTDVLLINGAGLEEFLGDLIENAPTAEPVIVGQGIQMLPFSDEMGHAHDDDHADEAHDEDDHSDESHDEDDHSDESHDDDDHSDEAHDDDHDHSDDEYIGALGDGACETDDDHADESHDEDDHSDESHDEEDHDDHAHDHGPCDPHYWTTPDNARIIVNNIADALAAADPDNADTYRTNADNYVAELDETAELVQEILNEVPEDRRVLVTNHEFLGYFAHEYGFEIVGVVIPGGATLAEPGPRDLIELAETLREERINVIFAEVSQTQDLAQAVAAEVEQDVQVVTLYSGSLSDADGPAGTYLDYLLYNARQIADALADEA